MKYFTVVLVQLDSGSKRIYEAPSSAYFEEGDLVEVESCCGPQMGRVLAAFSSAGSNDAYQLLLKLIGIDGGLRHVLAKFDKRDYYYANIPSEKTMEEEAEDGDE